MTAAVVAAENSYATLPPDGSLVRTPRFALRPRPAAFSAAFDATTLFYDCFWHDDGQRVLLVGPPWRNLGAALRRARVLALPARLPVQLVGHHSLSVTVTEVRVPRGTTALAFTIGDTELDVPVRPSFTQQFAGRRVLFSMNRDNELGWIAEWARYHARLHGTDAVVLFDNGSTRYGPDEIVETLRAVPGLELVSVPRWPYRFGPVDQAVLSNPYWPRFLQISSMSVVLRRFGERAAGLLDCDVDELAGTRSGKSIYDFAQQSAGGLVAFTGTWIEATGGVRHRDFTQRLRNDDAARSAQRKWALDPSRNWVRKLSVHPYWHWIEGRARGSKSMPEDAFYWHFKGINTNWKHKRTAAPNREDLVEDPLLTARLALLPD